MLCEVRCEGIYAGGDVCVFQTDVRVGVECEGVYMVCEWQGVSVCVCVYACMCVVGDKKGECEG